MERRGRDRVRASFVLRILPGESRVHVRSGDVSPTGLFVEVEHEIGEPGELKHLRLGTRDGLHIVEVDARIVRVVRSDDLLAGSRIHGVAFEMLLTDDDAREEMAALVAHLRRGELVDHEELPAGLCVRLETPWKLRAGERISVEVPTEEGKRVRVDARAVDSRARKNGHYATRFSLERGEDEVGDRDVSGIRLALAQRAPELSGELGALSLPTLLVLLSMEQLSGVLRLCADEAVRHYAREAPDESRGFGDDARHASRESASIRVFLRQGHVVDVEGPTDTEGRNVSPRALLARAVEWTSGSFSFGRRDVSREDRLRTSTTALLIDLAREHDENRREVA